MSYDFLEDFKEEKVISGNESFSTANTKIGFQNPIVPTMSFFGNDPQAKEHPGTRLHIRTNDNVTFRIYFCANTIIDSPYFQNRFCLFLDSLNEQQKVVIELGTGLNGSFPDTQIGMMISSIKNCKADVTTVAAGRCGFAESCLFIYGKNRKISDYGALLFNGIKSYEEKIPMYADYFKQIFTDGLKNDVYDREVYNTLLTSGKFVMINSKEVIIP